MSIEGTLATQAVSPNAFERETFAAKTPAASVNGQKPCSRSETSVHISETAQKIASRDTNDVDMHRVTAIQQALAAGEYHIDSHDIAGKLVRHVIETGR